LAAPPRLASTDLPPAAVAALTQALADHWRLKFAELLEEAPAEAEAAA